MDVSVCTITIGDLTVYMDADSSDHVVYCELDPFNPECRAMLDAAVFGAKAKLVNGSGETWDAKVVRRDRENGVIIVTIGEPS